MAKEIYCAICGVRVEVKLKALPKLGRVVGIVVPHVCSDDVTTDDLERLIAETKGQPIVEKDANFPFIDKLNREMGKLEQPTFKDRREERDVSSTAPGGLSSLLAAKGKLQTDPRETGASGSEEPDDGGFEMGD